MCKMFPVSHSTSKSNNGQFASRTAQAAKAIRDSGVDYAGPFILKAGSGRAFKTSKAYVYLFMFRDKGATLGASD